MARRVLAEHPDAILLTADTLVEDEDNWRFGKEAVAWLGSPRWEIVADGRTPMEVGRDQHIVPNNRMAVCSEHLKRNLLRRWLEANCDPAATVVYLGYDWTEDTRLADALPHWPPWTVRAPLTEPPLEEKPALLARWLGYGIRPPRLYDYGFSHANCGGACVRGGQAQWELLLRTNRQRYLDWEADEELSRARLGKDVSILRDRRGGRTRPLSLRAFRRRLEAQPGLFDGEDWGACGCL